MIINQANLIVYLMIVLNCVNGGDIPPTEAQIIAADWTLVRETTSTSTWHQASDNLAGTDVYGTEGGPGEWSVNFETKVPEYSQILFISGDHSTWLNAFTRAIDFGNLSVFGYAIPSYTGSTVSGSKPGQVTCYAPIADSYDLLRKYGDIVAYHF